MYQVLLFYKYVTLDNPQAVADRMRGLAAKHKLLGRGIVAHEGVNATFEGLNEDTERFLEDFLTDERLADMNIKRSAGTGKAFPKLSVKVRDEIVGTRFPKEMADPEVKTTPHIPAEELHALYRRGEDFVVIDMRNSYEYASGHFKNSIDPGMEASRDLPKVVKKLEPYKGKKVITVCTGGVRCEKMSAYLMNNGFADVSQLENGIHAYMEKYPGEDFLGALYTFDKRVVMDFGGNREKVGTCTRCGVSTEHYINCANLACHAHLLVCEDCAPEGYGFCSDTCAQAPTPQKKAQHTF